MRHQPEQTLQFFPLLPQRRAALGGPEAAEPRDGEREACRLDRDPVVHDAGIVRRVVDGGIDYVRVCWRHQWSSVPVTRRADVPACVACDAEVDAEAGRQRYRELVGLWDRR